MGIKVNVNVGIIEGDKKRALECYLDSMYFRQRKQYDEYYVDVSDVEINAKWVIGDLMIIAEHFTVTVGPDSIEITSD